MMVRFSFNYIIFGIIITNTINIIINFSTIFIIIIDLILILIFYITFIEENQRRPKLKRSKN